MGQVMRIGWPSNWQMGAHINGVRLSLVGLVGVGILATAPQPQAGAPPAARQPATAVVSPLPTASGGPLASRAGQIPAETPAFRASTELVVMHVVVRDRDGGYVEGLSPEAFHLFENGTARDMALFAHQDTPVTIGLVIDASGSMLASRARLAYAVARFAEAGHPGDEVFALVVGDRVRSVLPAERPFTNESATLMRALHNGFPAGGRTALWDGVAEGLRYLARGSNPRRALVVISDGHDNISRTRFDEVLVQVQASNAAVYTVGLINPMELDRRPKALRQLAGVSGGDAFFPRSHADALTALQEVAREIRSAYTIGFTAVAAGRDGQYHKLRVDVDAPDGRRLQIRTRAGYLAGLR